LRRRSPLQQRVRSPPGSNLSSWQFTACFQ
jgi:hypothetical protein